MTVDLFPLLKRNDEIPGRVRITEEKKPSHSRMLPIYIETDERKETKNYCTLFFIVKLEKEKKEKTDISQLRFSLSFVTSVLGEPGKFDKNTFFFPGSKFKFGWEIRIKTNNRRRRDY